MEFLAGPKGRKKIMAWMGDKDLHQRPNFGIEELNTLMEEMKRTKAGTCKLPPAGETAGAGAQPAAGETAEAGAQGAGETAEAGPAEDEDDGAGGALPEGPDGGELEESAVDPVAEKASALAEQAAQKISVHRESAAWVREVQASVLPSTKAILVVDAPTTRMGEMAACLGHAASVPGDHPA